MAMYKLAVVLALVNCAVARVPHSRIRPTPWKDCGSTNIVINDVEVEGCTAAPCVLPKGSNMSITITFTPKQKFSDLVNKLYGLIGGVLVPFPLPQPDVCKLGVRCPMKAGTQYVEVVYLVIQPEWPSVEVSAVWRIDDTSGNLEGCFKFPLKITDLLP